MNVSESLPKNQATMSDPEEQKTSAEKGKKNQDTAMSNPEHQQTSAEKVWGTVVVKGSSLWGQPQSSYGLGQSRSSQVNNVGWSSVNTVKNPSLWNTSTPTSCSGSRQQTSAPTSWSVSRQQTSADSNSKFSRSYQQSAWETANRFKKNVCRNWPTRNDRNNQHGPRTFDKSSGGNFRRYRSDFRSASLLSCHNKKELSIVNNIKPHEKVGLTHHT